MADDHGEEEEDERAIELASIAAIYPEIVLESSFTASLEIPVEPTSPIAVFSEIVAPKDVVPTDQLQLLNIPEVGARVGTSEPSNTEPVQGVHLLTNLPSLTLQISLPEGYPGENPPIFDIQTSAGWLPRSTLQELSDEGLKIWEDMGRDQVVFSYIDFLREAAENGFGKTGLLEVTPEMQITLLEFDRTAKRAKFEQETFDCGICLEPKKGSACHRLLLCSHVFCIECLQDFYNTCIAEGDVGNVKCMAPKCGGEPTTQPKTDTPPTQTNSTPTDSTLDPSELLQISLSQETVQRYIKLKRKKFFESNRSTVYCPRQWCQGPARLPNAPFTNLANISPDSTTSSTSGISEPPLPPPAERLAICMDCTFAFCSVCSASWHGEYNTCNPRSAHELSVEERASKDYIEIHTTPCPTCNVRAQKTMGCNHMICAKCDTHFCYLCASYLDKDNPYQHYNKKGQGCYMRLWELEGGDGREVGQGFGGGVDGGPGDWGNGLDEDEEFDLGEDDSDDSDDSDDENEPAAPIPPAARPNPPAARPLPPPARPNLPAARPNPPAQPLANAAALARQQQNAQPAGRAVPRREDVQGLQRFLALVREDQEEEWDSDEMGEEFGDGLAGEIERWADEGVAA